MADLSHKKYFCYLYVPYSAQVAFQSWISVMFSEDAVAKLFLGYYLDTLLYEIISSSPFLLQVHPYKLANFLKSDLFLAAHSLILSLLHRLSSSSDSFLISNSYSSRLILKLRYIAKSCSISECLQRDLSDQ